MATRGTTLNSTHNASTQGRFEIGDAFAREAALECEDSLKRPFEHMHMVLQQVHTG
jgi:hypothetical protein